MENQNFINDLEDDEKFIISEKAKYKAIKEFLSVLEKHFDEKYGMRLGVIKIEFNDVSRDFVISCDKGVKKVEYLESIPKAVMEFREE